MAYAVFALSLIAFLIYAPFRKRFGTTSGYADVRALLEGTVIAACVYLDSSSDFSHPQAAKLAMLAGTVATVISICFARTEVLLRGDPIPFHVLITPMWIPLLVDHGVSDQENIPHSSGRTQIRFTCLRPGLFFNNDTHSFFHSIDRSSAELESLRPKELSEAGKELIERIPGERGIMPLPPTVILWERGNDWQFCLMTEETRWRGDEWDTESPLIPFATLPRPWEIFSKYSRVPLSNKRQQRLEANLAVAGWKKRESIWLNSGFDLEHKYLTISFCP